MTKPEFVNAFVVSTNDNQSEVVISCRNEYPNFPIGTTEEQMNNVQLQKELVINLVLSVEGAGKLRDLLIKVLPDENNNPGEEQNE